MHFSFGKKEEANRNLIEQIILEKYNQYYRLAYGYVHNEADAGDIVQSGTLRALKNSHTLKRPEYAQTWVYRIMLNECFRHLEKPRLLSYESIQDENGQVLGYTEDCHENLDLLRAMDALSEKEKAVVMLKYFEEMTLEEIADILDENVNTVKSRLYRSLKKLRGVLAADTPEILRGEYDRNGGVV